MKHFLSIALMAGGAALSLASCKDMQETDTAQMGALQDTILKVYPTAGAVQVRVHERTELYVVLGDSHLYTATPEQKQREANEIGRMAMDIFGRDSYLLKGQLTVTKDERNKAEKPKDGIVIPINMDSLKKAAGK